MTRKVSAVWAALLAATCALALAAAPAQAAKPPRTFYGVSPQANLTDADYQNLGSGRVGTIRVLLAWPFVQSNRGDCTPQGGACHWGGYDDIIGRAASVGVRAVPFFYGSAQFANKDVRKPPLKGADLKEWRDFVQAAVQRYGRGGVYWKENFQDAYGGQPQEVIDWQVWNEPSSAAFWHKKPNARKYAKLLKASAKEIEGADRQANVLMGGLFGTPTIHMKAFLRQVYRVKGIERFFDEISIHPYAPDMRGIKLQIGWARSAARRANDRGAGIRISEMGWGSGGGGHPLQVGPKGQAEMLNKSFKLLTRKRGEWNITGINWFAFKDLRSANVCKFCRDAGLFTENSNAKPSWQAFQRFTK
jgi:hypothetical protein